MATEGLMSRKLSITKKAARQCHRSTASGAPHYFFGQGDLAYVAMGRGSAILGTGDIVARRILKLLNGEQTMSMSPSKIVGLVLVLLVSAYFRGWQPSHAWLSNWIAIVGVAYVVVALAEWLKGSSLHWEFPHRRQAPPAAPAE